MHLAFNGVDQNYKTVTQIIDIRQPKRYDVLMIYLKIILMQLNSSSSFQLSIESCVRLKAKVMLDLITTPLASCTNHQNGNHRSFAMLKLTRVIEMTQ